MRPYPQDRPPVFSDTLAPRSPQPSQSLILDRACPGLLDSIRRAPAASLNVIRIRVGLGRRGSTSLKQQPLNSGIQWSPSISHAPEREMHGWSSAEWSPSIPSRVLHGSVTINDGRMTEGYLILFIWAAINIQHGKVMIRMYIDFLVAIIMLPFKVLQDPYPWARAKP